MKRLGNEEILLEIATARAERDAAIAYARAESRKAESAEHWRKIAEAKLSKAKDARRKIYEILKAHGYSDGSCYGELRTPAPHFRSIVRQDKRAPFEAGITPTARGGE